MMAKNQMITYSGVGAQRQNGVTVRVIRTVIEQAQTMLIHAAIRNPDNVNATLWPFAMTHLAYVWNVTPREGTILPNATLTRTILNEKYPEVCWLKIWGCPVYILDYNVASGQKLPKWEVK